MIDRFTRWPEAVPLQNMTAETVAKAFITNWVARFGVPEKLTTDQGRQFESELFKKLSSRLGINHLRTTPYHPQSNGQIERVHRQLKAALICANKKSWTEALPIVLLGMRSTLKEDIKATSAELTYGTVLRLPGEFFENNNTDQPNADPEYLSNLRAVMSQYKPKQASNHNKRAPTYIQPALESCTHVFVRIDSVKASLTPPYDGPFPVVKKGPKTFTVEIRGKRKVISIDRLKAAFFYPQDEPKSAVTPVPRPAPSQHPTWDTVPAKKPLHQTRYGRNIFRPERF